MLKLFTYVGFFSIFNFLYFFLFEVLNLCKFQKEEKVRDFGEKKSRKCGWKLGVEGAQNLNNLNQKGPNNYIICPIVSIEITTKLFTYFIFIFLATHMTLPMFIGQFLDYKNTDEIRIRVTKRMSSC